MTKMQEYIQKGEDYILKTYNRYPVVFEKGDGVCLYDMDGKRYLDFAAGIAVFALGYNNKTYNDALKEQIDKILHTSNLYIIKIVKIYKYCTHFYRYKTILIMCIACYR